ncbi:MAG: hypothetical protein C5B57_01120 [Blastocatellia bacterium]|nr:MAG: hypothetical protein C5B57_01120 [Blastocatellia bacterium]
MPKNAKCKMRNVELLPPCPRATIQHFSLRTLHCARRRSRLCTILFLACVLAQANAASARDFLWKVTGKTGSVYLVGSVHLLTQDFYPLSAAFERAFAESDLLVEETDFGELTSPQAQMLMLSRGMLPSNQSLDKVVSPATFAKISARATQLGVPIEPLKRFKPWMLALTLAALEWQKAGFDVEYGLDKHFYDRARKDNKRVEGLETAAFQISRFDGLSPDQQERLLAETLKDLDSEMANISKIAEAWKSGDAQSIENIVLQDLKDDTQMYQRLLVERNRNWMTKLDGLLTRPGRAFIVVGAAHLVGPDGLLVMLKSKGYEIEQM